MFAGNEGRLDRILRIIFGLALLTWFFLDQGTGVLHWAKLIGVMPILTAVVGFCPLYKVLGICT